ncbi:MAG: hypothetical protein ACP5RI_03765 [Candidatus Micrarchaeia archaeon]
MEDYKNKIDNKTSKQLNNNTDHTPTLEERVDNLLNNLNLNFNKREDRGITIYEDNNINTFMDQLHKRALNIGYLIILEPEQAGFAFDNFYKSLIYLSEVIKSKYKRFKGDKVVINRLKDAYEDYVDYIKNYKNSRRFNDNLEDKRAKIDNILISIEYLIKNSNIKIEDKNNAKAHIEKIKNLINGDDIKNIDSEDFKNFNILAKELIKILNDYSDINYKSLKNTINNATTLLKNINTPYLLKLKEFNSILSNDEEFNKFCKNYLESIKKLYNIDYLDKEKSEALKKSTEDYMKLFVIDDIDIIGLLRKTYMQKVEEFENKNNKIAIEKLYNFIIQKHALLYILNNFAYITEENTKQIIAFIENIRKEYI